MCSKTMSAAGSTGSYCSGPAGRPGPGVGSRVAVAATHGPTPAPRSIRFGRPTSAE